jgi:hypothetical protein
MSSLRYTFLLNCSYDSSNLTMRYFIKLPGELLQVSTIYTSSAFQLRRNGAIAVAAATNFGQNQSRVPYYAYRQIYHAHRRSAYAA